MTAPGFRSQIDFIALMEPVARLLLGEPNARLSSKQELRFGTHGSMSVDLTKGVWHDHESGEGGGVLDLIKREKSLTGADVIRWLEEQGIKESDRRDDNVRPLGNVVETYPYPDASGTVRYEVVRFEPKDFRQRRRDADGGWAWNLHGVTPLPYKLPELIEAIALDTTIFVVEGERDVHSLIKLGIPATCNSGGAGNWDDRINKYFRDADVVVIADNDPQAKNSKGELLFHKDGRPKFPGQDHANRVCETLQGVAKRVRYLDLKKAWAACPPKGDVTNWIEAGGAVERLWSIADELPDWTPPIAEPSDPLGVWDAGDDTELPPPRGWLLGNRLCRRFLASVLADGGVGKTATNHAELMSCAIGRSLTGDHVFQRCRVLIVSLEDDDTELKRRILAARLHHNVDTSELKGWLFLSAPGSAAGKLMFVDNRGRLIKGELAAHLEAQIISRKIDIVSIDPFVKAHSVEENNNALIDDVAQVLSDLADKYNIAVDAPHHTSKGSAEPGNADRGRGASAMKNAFRLVYTLATMSPLEAKAFGIDERQRKQYIRRDSGKVNITPPMAKAKWFRLVSIRLGNATDLYPNGDEVQTVEPWKPPDTWTDLTDDLMNAILNEIDAGLPDGSRYSDAPNAKKRAVWKVVTKHAPTKTEVQAREIIRTWVQNGLLVADDYYDQAERKDLTGLKVDPTKRPGTRL